MDWLSTLAHVTPVQRCGGIIFKRDDFFRPFERKELNGGKLRQVITVLRDCRLSGVITAASIHSPQIPLVAGAANYLGLRCVVVVGGKAITKELRIASELGAEVRRVASGRHRALYAAVSRMNADLGYYVVPYGIAPTGNEREFLRIQGLQVKNVPEDVDTLVVTCGSGVSAAGILFGLWRFSKPVSKLVLVATAPSRLEKVLTLIESVVPDARGFLDSLEIKYVDLFADQGFRYEQAIPFKLCGVELHPRYEAKAFRHILETDDYVPGRTLFWIVGADLSKESRR